jgi:hypothetical protein
VTDAMRASARTLAIIVAGGVAGAIAVGIGLGLAQGESVVTWIAYMLYVAGALVIGFAFFTGAPSSPRKIARQGKEKFLKEEMDKQRGVKPARAQAVAVEADATPFMSELVLLVCAGAVLFGAGLLVELVT